MFKLIKWLILIAIVAGIVLWFTDMKVKGKSLKDRFNEFKSTQLYQEGVKDFRSIVGESLKALGQEVSGDVTDDERKELENLIKKNITEPPSKPAAESAGKTDANANEANKNISVNKSKPEGNTQWQQQTLKPQAKPQTVEAKPGQTKPAPAKPTPSQHAQ